MVGYSIRKIAGIYAPNGYGRSIRQSAELLRRWLNLARAVVPIGSNRAESYFVLGSG
jgi:hypothetical protein